MKDKMLVITYQMNLGGVSIAASNFVNQMKDDYQISMAVAVGGGELINRLPKNVEVKFLKSEKRSTDKKFINKLKNRFVKLFLFGLRLIGFKNCLCKRFAKKNINKNEEYDIVINNDMDMSKYSFGQCHLYAKFVKARTKILVIHGDFVKNNYDQKFFKKEYLPVYDKIVLLSFAQQKVMEEIYPNFKEKFTTIQNFENDEEIVKLSNEYEVEYPKDLINLVSVSRLCEVKAYSRTLKQIIKLKSEGFKFCWHIIGDGELRDDLETFVKNNDLTDCVKFYGYRKNPYPFMKSADFLALLSYHESYGLVAIESLICGKPVLLTRTIAADEIVTKEQGIVCENSEEGVYQGLKDMFINYKQYQKNTKEFKFNNLLVKNEYKNLFKDYR